MVKLTTAEAMQKAIDKARAVKPLVRIVNFGSYIVTNKQTGATYMESEKKRGRYKMDRLLTIEHFVYLHHRRGFGVTYLPRFFSLSWYPNSHRGIEEQKKAA